MCVQDMDAKRVSTWKRSLFDSHIPKIKKKPIDEETSLPCHIDIWMKHLHTDECAQIFVFSSTRKRVFVWVAAEKFKNLFAGTKKSAKS